MLKFLIADDHAVVREGLKQILGEEFPQAMFGEAQDAQALLQQVREGSWDLLILDISLPGRSGLDALKDLKLLAPKLPILVLSIHPEEHYAVRTLKAGASAYMTKDNPPEELVKAVRKIMGGGKYVSPSLGEKLASDLGIEAEIPPHETLSDREFQVMLMIASGKTVTKIAEELHLSPKTVSTYRARILEKMRINTSAELTHYAFKNRLLE